MFSRRGSVLLPASADARYIDGVIVSQALGQIKTATASDTDCDTDDDNGDENGASAARGDGDRSGSAGAGGAHADVPSSSIEVQSVNVKIVNVSPEPENAYKHYHYIDEVMRRREALRQWQDSSRGGASSDGDGAGSARGGDDGSVGSAVHAVESGSGSGSTPKPLRTTEEQQNDEEHEDSKPPDGVSRVFGAGADGDTDGILGGGTGGIRTQVQWEAAIQRCANRSQLLAIGKELKAATATEKVAVS